MEQNDHALATSLRGDQRRAVGKRCPRAFGKRRLRSGQHLAGHRDVVGDRHAEEGALARESGQRLRLIPGKRSAENASAAAQPHRYEVVFAGRKPRPGKSYQNAAFVDPTRKTLFRFRDIADIGEDHHRQALVEKLGDGLCRRAALGKAHIGERRKRPRQIVGRSQERL